MVTVVFADLAGFTTLAEGRDPEQVKELLDRCFGVMVPVIESHGGHVDKLIGDELMALFGAPTAHDDDPERAVRAALALAPALAPLAPDLVLRIGVNTGEVLAGPVGPGRAYTVTGDTVNTAHRLVSVAQPGEVLVAERTWAATSLGIDYEARDTFQLRGKQQPVQAWAATAARAGGAARSGRRSAPLVGRRSELAELRRTVARAFDRRRPTVVTITGEPGVGKTRLATELALASWGGPGDVRTLWANCPAYGAANGLAPVADLVRTALGIDGMDAPARQLARLEEVLGDADEPDQEPALLSARVARLLDIDGAPNRLDRDAGSTRGRLVDQLLWGANRVLAAVAARQPTVVVLDDVQWADEAVLRFLAQLPAAVRDVPLIVLALAREDLLERRPGLVTSGPGLGSLALSPLGSEPARRLIGELLMASAPGASARSPQPPDPGELPRLGPDVEPRVLEAAGGNPFLLEQLVGYLVEGGALAEIHGRWQATTDFDEAGLPDGVRSLLGARLDALPHDEREFIADAAVVGRSFWVEAVQALRRVPHPDEVVERLLAKGLIVRQGEQAALGELSFAHALTRDVAYASVPLGERAQKHARVATWLRGRIDPDNTGPAVGLLAHHYERAVMLNRSLEHTDPGLAGAAFAALVQAAEHAETFDALREAEEWYRRARQLGTLDRRQGARAVLGHGRVLTELRQLEAATAAFEEAINDAEDLPELRAEATAHLGAVARLDGNGDQARDHFERSLEEWRALGDLAGEADTVRLQGWSELTVGRVRAALPRLLRAVDLERAAGTGPRGTTLQSLGWCEFQVGAIADAQRHLWEAMQLLGSAGASGDAGWCFGVLGFTFLILGQISQARSIAENLLELARIQSDPWAEARCRLLLAGCLVAAAEISEAERLVIEADRPLSDRDTLWEQAMLLLVRGRIARGKGEIDQARQLLRNGLETSRGTSYVGAEARLLIELAGLELEAGNPEIAEDRARATLALVRAGLGDEDSQLRARIVLARLARQRGDHADAELQLEDVIATGSGLRDPTTDTWRIANAELALMLAESGEVERAGALAADAGRDGVETVRVLLLVEAAKAAVEAAHGRSAEGAARLDQVLERYPEGPIVQRRQVSELRDRLSG